MVLRYEAWTTPWDPAGFKRKVAMLPVIEGTGKGSVEFMSVGRDASADISLANFDRIDDLASDTESSLITVYDCDHTGTNTIIDEWILDRVPRRLNEEKTASLAGPNLLREAFDKTIVYPFDYPKKPSVQRDHIWGKHADGDTTGKVRNGTFEDVPFPNGGFEDGNIGYWQATESDGDLFASSTVQAIQSAVDARSGSWYGTVIVNEQGDGVRRSITGLIVGETYTITGWINEPTGNGDRIRAGIGGAESASHTNAYEEKGYHWAELDNAAQGTGASTGSYQQVTLTFIPQETTVELVVIYDDVNGLDFNIDDFTMSGMNVGLDPWDAFAIRGQNPGDMEVNTFAHTTAQANNGAGSVHFQGVDDAFYGRFGQIGYGTIGFGQEIQMIPGRLYTMTAWAYHDGTGDNGTNELLRIVLNRLTPSGPLAETITGEFRPAPGSYFMAGTTVSVPANTWTKIQMTVIADVSEIRAEFRYAGTNVTTDVGPFNSPNIYVDDISVHEGLPATTIGDIWQQLLDDCTINHANQDRGTILEWIDYSSFDAVNDSNGNPWDNDIPFLARFGSTMGHVLDDTFDRGYEIELVRKATPSGGKTHDLHLYNTGGRDDDPSAAIHTGQPVTGGESLKRNPAHTMAMVASPDGAYHEVVNTGALADFGRMEAFLLDSDVSGPVSRQLLADNLINYEEANRKAVRFNVVEAPGVPRPLFDYRPGDTIPMTMAPNLLKEDRRVQRVSYVNTNPTQYSVVGSSIIEGEAAAFDLVARLWRRMQRPGPYEEPDLGLGLGGDAGFFAIDVAADDAPDWEKAVARYVCDGVDDHVEIQAAMDESFNEGLNNGEVTLSSGNFNIDEGRVTVLEGSVLRGQGQMATIIKNQTIGTIHDSPSSNNGVYLIDVSQDGELYGLSFETTNDFQGTCVISDYALVHDINHVTGSAQRFLYLEGTIGPTYNIRSWGFYNNVPVADRRACIETNENWVALTGVYMSIHGTGLWLGDHQGGASITGMAIDKNGTEPAIFMGDVGYVAMGDISIRDFNGEGSGIICENPNFVSLSNINIQGTTVGMAAAEGFWGPNLLDVDSFIVEPFVSGIDFYLDDGSGFARDVSIRGFRCDGSQSGKGSGWGIRMGGAFGSGKYLISDFDIEGMDEDGILLLNGPVEAAIINDGILTNVGKHGVVLDDVVAQVHDVVVNGAGQVAANTYDAFHLRGAMDGATIHHNKILGASQLRYGINLANNTVERTIVVGNAGPDSSEFGTDALNDQGTGTQLTYPSDVTYGDNFFISDSSSGAAQLVSVTTASNERESSTAIGVNPTQTITVTEATETESGETVTPT